MPANNDSRKYKENPEIISPLTECMHNVRLPEPSSYYRRYASQLPVVTFKKTEILFHREYLWVLHDSQNKKQLYP
jgi:hypothetical protein